MKDSESFVYVVAYDYSYEGYTIEACYSTEEGAKSHPRGGDKTLIFKFPILEKYIKNWDIDGKNYIWPQEI